MSVKLKNIAIVLHRPSYPENIGAAARAACNMGISQLIVVDPRDCDLLGYSRWRLTLLLIL